MGLQEVSRASRGWFPRARSVARNPVRNGSSRKRRLALGQSKHENRDRRATWERGHSGTV